MGGFIFACLALVVLALSIVWEKHCSGLTWDEIIANANKAVPDKETKDAQR